MKIHVKHEVCIGAGQCVVSAPEVFDQNDDDGLVVVLDESPAPELHARVREAARVCPARVIELAD
jgi:ferredoxin